MLDKICWSSHWPLHRFKPTYNLKQEPGSSCRCRIANWLDYMWCCELIHLIVTLDIHYTRSGVSTRSCLRQGNPKPWKTTTKATTLGARVQSLNIWAGHTEPGAGNTASQQLHAGWYDDSCPGSTGESSEKQQEGGPQMRLERELQYNSKVQQRNAGRDRPAGRCTYSITRTETLDSG